MQFVLAGMIFNQYIPIAFIIYIHLVMNRDGARYKECLVVFTRSSFIEQTITATILRCVLVRDFLPNDTDWKA